MLLFIALCFAVALAGDIQEKVPRWSKMYTMRMDMYIPSMDYHSSHKVWYDGFNDRVRLDNYKTTTQFTITANLTDLYKSPTVIVRPYTDEKHMNMRFCFEFHNKFMDYSMLPNMRRYAFEYRGVQRLHSEDADHWALITERDMGRIEYHIWVVQKNGEFVPLKWEITFHNTENGLLFGHTYTDVYDFDTSEIDPKVFDIGSGLDCKVINEEENSTEAYSAKHAMDYLRLFYNPELYDQVSDEFELFKFKFDKSYNTQEEHNKRRKIFEDNVRFINEHNKAGHSYKMKVNHMADLTPEELTMMLGSRAPKGPSHALPFPYSAEEIERMSDDIPDHFDWRPHGAVTAVKDQGPCGSCWAFSAVGAMEGALFLHNGRKKLVRLSEQALVDCSSGFHNHGCGGGYPEHAYDWIKVHGLPNDDAYGGYIFQDSLCHIDNVTKEAYVKAYYKVPKGNEKALKVVLLKHGPISVLINAPPHFVFYSHGVFYSKECSDYLNHAVLLVGYGILNGEQYWLIKNSWGPNWGASGYILMSTKDNNCCVECDAHFVQLR